MNASTKDVRSRAERLGVSSSLASDCGKCRSKWIKDVILRTPLDGMVCGPQLKVHTHGHILPILYALSRSAPGDILYIENTDNLVHEALLGDIVLSECLRREIRAVICTGSVRDLPAAKDFGLPVWSGGCSPVAARFGCPSDVDRSQVKSAADTWIFADEDGCVSVQSPSMMEFVIRCGLKKRREDRYISRIKTTSLLEMMNVEPHVDHNAPIIIEM